MNEVKQLQNLEEKESIVFYLKQTLSDLVKKEFEYNLDSTEIEINSTSDTKFGDYSSNISLKLSKILQRNPLEIAEKISTNFLKNNDFIEKVEVAGPGFVNLYLKTNYLLQNLVEINTKNFNYGKWNLVASQAMVEFGQPNTHKAFHIGHLKSAITGLSIVRLIENLGYNVIQANFYGDIGMHVAKCIWGFKNSEKPNGLETMDPHLRMKFLDQCYTFGSHKFKEDPNIELEIREINKKIYDKSDADLLTTYLQTREWSLEHQNDIFSKLGIAYERQYPESEIFEEALKIVRDNLGEIFLEDQEAIIFPGEKYGLDRWVFITKDGNPTYSAKDMGLAHHKFQDFPDLDFNITSTSIEQNAYFKAVIKALSLINQKYVDRYYHIGFGWLLRNNKKTSSRMGDSIKGMDIIAEAIDFAKKKISEDKSYDEIETNDISQKVAIAGLKFLILSREIHKDINYDPEVFLNPEGFSGPYIMYGYVRAKGILRISKNEINLENILNYSIEELSESEINLLKLLERYPLVNLDASKTLSPHKICNYLFELTQAFNQFYRENKVLDQKLEVTNFRLGLIQAFSIIIKNGLNLLGIETIEKM